MPARHGGPVAALLLPPVMGSMLDFRHGATGPPYRLYISGDTLLFDDLADIPRRFPDVDLALLPLVGPRVFGMLRVMMYGDAGVAQGEQRRHRLAGPARNAEGLFAGRAAAVRAVAFSPIEQVRTA